MSEWGTRPLSEITDVLDNRRVPVREEDRPAGSVPYYGANGQQGWIDRALFDEPLILLAGNAGTSTSSRRDLSPTESTGLPG